MPRFIATVPLRVAAVDSAELRLVQKVFQDAICDERNASINIEAGTTILQVDAISRDFRQVEYILVGVAGRLMARLATEGMLVPVDVELASLTIRPVVGQPADD